MMVNGCGWRCRCGLEVGEMGVVADCEISLAGFVGQYFESIPSQIDWKSP